MGSEPLIIYDKESTYFVLMDRVCREAGIVPNIAMDLDSIESTKRMIERGLGVSFLPYKSVEREFRMGTLAHVQLEEGHRITLPTAAMVRRASSYGPLVTAFLDGGFSAAEHVRQRGALRRKRNPQLSPLVESGPLW